MARCVDAVASMPANGAAGDNAVGGVSNSVGGITGAGDIGGGNVGGGDTSVADVANLSDVINLMDAGEVNATDLADVSEFDFVDVSDVGNFDAAALNDALNGNASNIDALRNALSGNQAFLSALEGNNLDLTDVVAINNHQDGSVTIYTSEQN